MPQANISIKMDENLKKDFDEVCSEMGLTMTAAITVFAKAVTQNRMIPFEVSLPTARAETLAIIERIENGTAEMAGPFKTFEEYKAWVTSDEEDEI